ncbi:unnamed protein product [Closterium sp. Naga37s-1]|nr:unnamed protein product [Closterium sp. Naga37s-1]
MRLAARCDEVLDKMKRDAAAADTPAAVAPARRGVAKHELAVVDFEQHVARFFGPLHARSHTPLPPQALSANSGSAELWKEVILQAANIFVEQWMEVGAEREALGRHETTFEAFTRAIKLLLGDAEALKRRGAWNGERGGMDSRIRFESTQRAAREGVRGVQSCSRAVAG